MSKTCRKRYDDLTYEYKEDLWNKISYINNLPLRFDRAKKFMELRTLNKIPERTFVRWKKNLTKEFEKGGAENDFVVKGKSSLIDADGNIKLQWIKEYAKENDIIKMYEKVINKLNKKIIPLDTIIVNDFNFNEDTMTIYGIGDAHIGLLAWKAETGEDHDLAIGEKDLLGAVKLLTTQAVNSKECFIIDVGDYFHSDNNMNKTAKSGNPLDVDGRYAKVLEVGLRLTTSLVELALKKHEIVHWRSAIGNHNEHSAIMLNAFVKATFRNNPRVIVHDEPSMFMYHKFGKNIIGVTHGHTVKAERLGSIMSEDCREYWSDTMFAYWYTGHVHHLSRKEYENCVVETFRSLVAKDAWHHGDGYRSLRDMQAITLHKEFGEISRNTAGIRMIRASI